jgi:hypothetical protein
MTPPIPPFGFDFGHSYDDILDCLPPVLRALTAKSEDVFGLAPETVAACGLAHLAAAAGQSTMMDDGTAFKTPGFNFVAISDQPGSGDGLSCIGRGWIEYASRLRTMPGVAQKSGQKPASRTRRPALPTGTAPSLADEQAVDVQPVEQMSATVDVHLLKDMIMRSPDRAATLIQGAGDPIEEWSRLKPDMQRHLSSLLRLSWQGRHLKPCPRSPALKASLLCLWQTQSASLKRVFFNPQNRGLDNPPPLLIHRMKGTPRRFPNNEVSEVAAWHHQLRLMFTLRLGAPAREMTLEYHGIAETFSKQVLEAMQFVPDPLHPWLDWTPGLLPRMYHLLLHDWHLTQAQAHQGPTPCPSDKEPRHVREELIYKAAILTTWMLQDHCHALEKLMEESWVEGPPDIPDFTDIELPWVILDCLREHGPLLRRELQRHFHQMTARDRDEALRYLLSQGEITETQDGKLILAA